uniref:ectonucleoside triphosphate diphosphohydrolase 3 n=1 Tax=Pristiophorus japonicus TaxID=55135 RepID=UPI00398EA678
MFNKGFPIITLDESLKNTSSSYNRVKVFLKCPQGFSEVATYAILGEMSPSTRGAKGGHTFTCPGISNIASTGGCTMGLEKPVAATLVILVSSVIVIVAIFVIQQFNKVTLPSGLKYGIVFDAGSPHTIVYVYNWPAVKETNTGVVSEMYKCQIEETDVVCVIPPPTGPAIFSYDSEPAQAARSMGWCLNKTMQQIPAEKHKATPAYLGATAGMRLLQLENSTTSAMILSAIDDYLHSSPFDFRGAQIISEKEEGIYGWITANYLLGNLRQVCQSYIAEVRNMLGTLDLGGASTEIAFVPMLDQVKLATTIITLYSNEYRIFTQSLACYGRDEAEKRYWAKLFQKSTEKSRIEDPCLPSNYTLTLQLENIFGSLCTAAEIPEKYDPDNNVTFIGTGHPALCLKELLLVFKFRSFYVRGNWIQHSSRLAGFTQPKICGDFVAFSGFYSTMEALNLTGSFSMHFFHSTVQSFCLKDWNQVQQLLPNVIDSSRRAYCFNANYIYALLVQGYKFDPVSWTRISFQKQVKHNSIGWSLGYMLNLTNMIPSENQVIQMPMSDAVFTTLLFLFAAIVLFCSIFICMSIIRSV